MLFFKFSICLYRNEHIQILPGARDFLLMHPMSAQNKYLSSNTGVLCTMFLNLT